MVWHEAIIEAIELKGEINLAWKQLPAVDPAVFTFERDYNIRMRALRLVGLGLSELPPEIFTNLMNLEVLSLTSNHLQHLPEEVANLSDLTELGLLNNRLQELPRRIGLLVSLQKLELANNRLESLPDTFAALSKLDRIDMESNLLKVPRLNLP